MSCSQQAAPRRSPLTQPFTTLAKQAPGATDRGGTLGPFKRKCVILAILETDGRTHATAALGRVVIDLSEFASIEGQVGLIDIQTCSLLRLYVFRVCAVGVWSLVLASSIN